MQLEKRFRLHKATTKEANRYAMDAVSVELATDGDPVQVIGEERPALAVATNGRILAVVPVGLEEGDEPGFLPRQALVEACKGSKGQPATIRANGSIEVVSGKNLTVHERPDADAEFPRWRAIFPERSKLGAFRVSFNPRYLLDLAEAIGVGAEHPAVHLTFQRKGKGLDAGAPIHVDSGTGGVGVLMPITIEKGEMSEPVLPDPGGAVAGGGNPGALAELQGRYDRLVAELDGQREELHGARERIEDLEGAPAPYLDAYSSAELATELDRRFQALTAPTEPAAKPAPEPVSVESWDPGPDHQPEPIEEPERRRRPELSAVVRPGTKEGYREIEFSRKPRAEIREAVREAGFRWAGKRGCWYGPADAVPASVWAIVGEVVAL